MVVIIEYIWCCKVWYIYRIFVAVSELKHVGELKQQKRQGLVSHCGPTKLELLLRKAHYRLYLVNF